MVTDLASGTRTTQSGCVLDVLEYEPPKPCDEELDERGGQGALLCPFVGAELNRCSLLCRSGCSRSSSTKRAVFRVKRGLVVVGDARQETCTRCLDLEPQGLEQALHTLERA
eukprot:1952240-Rhodomonas_salina.1